MGCSKQSIQSSCGLLGFGINEPSRCFGGVHPILGPLNELCNLNHTGPQKSAPPGAAPDSLQFPFTTLRLLFPAHMPSSLISIEPHNPVAASPPSMEVANAALDLLSQRFPDK